MIYENMTTFYYAEQIDFLLILCRYPTSDRAFIHRFNGIYNKNICCLSDDAMAAMLNYDYPGNICKLENGIEHCFVLCQSDVIETRHLPPSMKKSITFKDPDISILEHYGRPKHS